MIQQAYRAKIVKRFNLLLDDLEPLRRGPPISERDRLVTRRSAGYGLLKELIESSANVAKMAGPSIDRDQWWLLFCVLQDLTPEIISFEELATIDRGIGNGEFGHLMRECEASDDDDEEPTLDPIVN